MFKRGKTMKTHLNTGMSSSRLNRLGRINRFLTCFHCPRSNYKLLSIHLRKLRTTRFSFPISYR
ncbi:uncharacterized protein EI90DRAFT_3057805 [Cantharellus anzutake]|uniref:uncharacterized protein n=1 Tax=Cantharellus anzutake TaxID=1750568 RepID=UPI001908BD02|nr:uncharacterized protein EI90DRAFT_3057805 [Cantharellus anzutake]KAF8331389.1 hypothetical protein EI90DRAFT_3057805 [Cantharellus anzutake]